MGVCLGRYREGGYAMAMVVVVGQRFVVHDVRECQGKPGIVCLHYASSWRARCGGHVRT